MKKHLAKKLALSRESLLRLTSEARGGGRTAFTCGGYTCPESCATCYATCVTCGASCTC